jgi:hypothetical protein
MDIDFFGTLNVTRLPHLKASGGRIVNVGSMAGLVGVFGETAYCAAKYAVTGFSEALRLEVEPQGVTVQLVCPGQFDTPMVEELNTYRTPENRALVGAFETMPLDQVTREVLKGIDRGDPLIIPGRIMRLSWLAQRIAPGLLRRFLRRQVPSVYQGPAAPTPKTRRSIGAEGAHQKNVRIRSTTRSSLSSIGISCHLSNTVHGCEMPKPSHVPTSTRGRSSSPSRRYAC